MGSMEASAPVGYVGMLLAHFVGVRFKGHLPQKYKIVSSVGFSLKWRKRRVDPFSLLFEVSN